MPSEVDIDRMFLRYVGALCASVCLAVPLLGDRTFE